MMNNITALGRYKIATHLGAGAFADVYKATDQTLERTVALKVLKPTLIADREAFARFVREAKITANLFNPHIATVLDMGEADGNYFLAMRYVEGKSLDKVLAEGGALPWEKALAITEQVGEALDFAHKKGLVHRDVKPQNILISEEEGAVLTDFGLVRAMASSGMTSTGSFLGTPAYMAPEVWEGQDATPATDQYSLACVLVEMVTGKVLFDGKTPPAVMTQHFNPLKLPVTWSPEVPSSFESILIKALAHDPGNRYLDIIAFINAILDSEPEATPKPKPKHPKTNLNNTPVRSSTLKGTPSVKTRTTQSTVRFLFVVAADGTPLYQSLPSSNNWTVWLERGTRVSIAEPIKEALPRIGVRGHYIEVADMQKHEGFVEASTISLKPPK